MNAKLNLKLLKRIVDEVKLQVKPLLGTTEGAKILGVGAGGDKTRMIDAVSEEAVFSALEAAGISCNVVSEERGYVCVGGGKSEGYLIVDSLDGTNNALRSVPFFALSLAAADKPRLSAIYVGLVADLYHPETFWAERGKGAMLNNHAIKPSDVEYPRLGLIGIDIAPDTPALLEKLGRLISQTHHLRHLGANSLELCYVAAGRIDAFVDLRWRLRVTDIAAAYLILKEAGACIVDEKNRTLEASLESPRERVSFVAASNRKLLEEILRLLA